MIDIGVSAPERIGAWSAVPVPSEEIHIGHIHGFILVEITLPWLGIQAQFGNNGISPETDYTVGVLAPCITVIIYKVRITVENFCGEISKSMKFCDVPVPSGFRRGIKVAVNRVRATGNAGDSNRPFGGNTVLNQISGMSNVIRIG